MAINRKRANRAYGLTNALQDLAPEPITAQRAPTTADFAQPGQLWLDQAGNDAYVLVEIVANSASWIAIGSGGGVFDTLTVTGAVTFSALGLGVMQSSATGVVSSSDGTDGQLLIGNSAAGVAPVFANILSADGTVIITNGASSIDLSFTGATASTFDGDAGTATPVAGVTNFLGDGVNLTSVGAGQDLTYTFSTGPTFSTGLIVTGGSTNITSSDDSATAITLTTNAGTSEKIVITNTQGTAMDSIFITGVVGGVVVTTALAGDDALSLTAPNGGITLDTGGQLRFACGENTADAISIDSENGGIDILASGASAGEDIDIIATGSSVNITSTEDAAESIYLHANGGTTEQIRIRSDQGTSASSVMIDSDVGGISIAGGLATTDAINLTAASGGIDIDAALEVSIVSTEDAAGSIYVHANGGTSETVRIHSDQGTGVDSIDIESDVGGISAVSGLASDDAINLTATAGGVDIDGALQINIASSEVAGDAIVINASDAAGGIDILGGSGDIDLTATAGNVNLTSTIDEAGAITLLANAGTSETILIHSDQGTGADSINLLSDVGGITLTSTGLASTDAINLVATVGGIDVDAALEINIATSEAVGDALNLVASAGGITATSGIDAADSIYIHADAGTSETVRLHSDQGTAATSISLTSDVGGATVTTGALAATTGLHVTQGAETAAIQVGTGAPSHAAPQGSLYLRTDGSSTSTRLYVNTDGNTTWTNFTSAA